MIRYIKNDIVLNKGDEGSIILNIDTDEGNYYVKKEDEIEFLVFDINSYNNQELKLRKIIKGIEGKDILIPLVKNDTNFVPSLNEEKKYFYQIKLNNSVVVLGYDFYEKSQNFIVLPTKEI